MSILVEVVGILFGVFDLIREVRHIGYEVSLKYNLYTSNKNGFKFVSSSGFWGFGVLGF